MKNRQNESKQLSLLCISDLLYKKVKKIKFFYNFFLAFPVVLSLFKSEIIKKSEKLNIFKVSVENLNTFILIATLVVGLLYFVFQFLEKNNLTKAVRIQEEFDVRVFNIKWNNLLAERFPDIEIIELEEEAKKISKEEKKDWYVFDEHLNDNENIFKAQKSALIYSRKLRETYLHVLYVLAIIFILCSLFLAWKMPLEKIVLNYFIPIYPIFQKYLDTILKVKSSINESESIYKYLDNTNAIGNNRSNLRMLQDWIFLNNRLYAPVIPTFIYKFQRTKLEKLISKFSS